MKLYHNSTEIFDIHVDDTSVRYRSIMQDNSLTLNFSTVEPVSVPVGSYCTFEGQRYTLFYPENFKKHNTRNFEYTLVLHGSQEALKLFKFKDLSAKPYRLKFPLTATAEVFLQLLVANMNEHDSGWSAGDCIVADDKLISFNHEYCYDVLNRVAQEFNTEWEIEHKTIHLRKVEKFKSDPLALSYGKGNGFKSGVGRTNEGDKQPIGRLYVQGGERNIDYSQYGSSTLLLPKSATLVQDGRTYRTDADGMFISRDGNQNPAEDSYDGSDIYPKRVGTVTDVIVVDEEKNFYDIVDSSIPELLNYGDCRIAGEKATIVFQSGALAGREFDIQQTDSALTGYDHEERKFQIVPQELDGFVMPGGVFVPKTGDKYAIFNISMPQAYISDDTTQGGASWDMFREAVRYFAENEEPRFSFRGELDGVWSRNKWLEIGGKIVPGGYVEFSDPQFQPDGIKIRITSIKDYVNMPHKPEITLSNAPISMSFASDLGKIEAEEVVRESDKKEIIRYTKRQWRDTLETMSLLEKSLLHFDKGINPITVQTMQLLVGDESLQFRFVNNKTNPTSVIHNVSFNAVNKKLTAPAGIIQHMTLGINTLKKNHAASEYKFWNVTQYVSPALDPDEPYYLYARVLRTGTTGQFLLSKTPIKMDAESNAYHLLVGILNSEFDGERSFVTLYGFTEILPGRVTTEKIVSNDGKTYFDLIQGVIGGNIRFLSNGTETSLESWASQLRSDLAGLDNQIDDFEGYINGAFKDGVIDAAEAKAIEKYINTIQSEKAGIEATYNKIYVNPLLSGTAKTNLLNSKITYFGDVDALINRINQVIADGKVTITEKQQVDNAFATYRASYALFSQRIQEANEFIQNVIGDNANQALADANQALANANIARAVTDKFGTTIDGGLISTVIMLLRDINSTADTAGTSGMQDGPAFWAGGTYAQAIAAVAKIILNHDGSGQLAGGDIRWGADGGAVLSDVLVNGRIINSFAGSPWYYVNGKPVLDITTNNNVLIDSLPNGSNQGWFTGYLPVASDLVGMTVNLIWVPRNVVGLHLRIASDGQNNIMTRAGYKTWIELTSDTNRHLQFLAIKYQNGVQWVLIQDRKLGSTFRGAYEDRVKIGEVFVQGTTRESGGILRSSSKFGFTCECTRQGTGYYTVTILKSPYNPLTSSNYTPIVSGYGGTFYAVVQSVTNNTFKVYTADDSTPNDSAFNFMLVANGDMDLRDQYGL